MKVKIKTAVIQDFVNRLIFYKKRISKYSGNIFSSLNIVFYLFQNTSLWKKSRKQ